MTTTSSPAPLSSHMCTVATMLLMEEVGEEMAEEVKVEATVS